MTDTSPDLHRPCFRAALVSIYSLIVQTAQDEVNFPPTAEKQH